MTTGEKIVEHLRTRENQLSETLDILGQDLNDEDLDLKDKQMLIDEHHTAYAKIQEIRNLIALFC